MKLEQSKEMGLYQSIQEQGIGYPIDVSTYPDGSMRIMSGAHRIAVAEDLGLKEVPVRDWGAQYESVFASSATTTKTTEAPKRILPATRTRSPRLRKL